MYLGNLHSIKFSREILSVAGSRYQTQHMTYTNTNHQQGRKTTGQTIEARVSCVCNIVVDYGPHNGFII